MSANHVTHQLCQLPLYLSPNVWGNMWLGEPERHAPTYHEPLEHRGWALQESLLSPRLVFYGSKGITWTCQTAGHIHLQLEDFHFNPDTGRLLPLPGLFQSKENPLKKSRTWKRIIENYCHRDFTHFQDRLPALGGVASALSKE